MFTLFSLGIFLTLILSIIFTFKGFFSKNWNPLKKSLIGLIACTTLSSITVPKDDNDSSNTIKSEKFSNKKSINSYKMSSKKSSSKSNSVVSSSLKEDSPIEKNSSTSYVVSSDSNYDNEFNNQSDNDNNIDNGTNHTAQAGKVIGNTKTHIYHTEDQHDYKINPDNEIVFSNEQDAINAGYRKALR